MLQIFRYIKGYLSIKVWGFSTERFMNLCSNHNIFLWDIKNHGDHYTMCISLKGFYQLRSITKKTGTRVAITGRYGLPFFLKRIQKRKIFIVGFIGSFLFLFWMESFIWNIELQGNFYVTRDVFMDFLEENNIHSGMKKNKVDIEALEKAIRNEYDIVTWTSAQIEGTKLIIQLKENDLITDEQEKEGQEEEGQIDTNGYHLIADKDGTIVSIITRSGIPKVVEGTEVKKGDILVEGQIPIYNEDTTIRRYEYCKADADILLKSSFAVTEKLNEKYEKKNYTGKEKVRFFLMIGQQKLQIPFLGKSYECFDVLEEKEQLCLFESFYLPVYFGKETVREYLKEEGVYSKEEIKNKFEEKVQKFMQTLEEKGVQIIEKNVTINKYKGTWSMKVNFTVTETVGTLKKVEPVLMEKEALMEEEQP